MEKNIIIEVGQDGLIQGVYCPDETYVVNVLDYNDWSRGVDESMDNYYADLEKEIEENLKDCW